MAHLHSWRKVLTATGVIFGFFSFVVPPLAAVSLITTPITVSISLVAASLSVGMHIKEIKKTMNGMKIGETALEINKAVNLIIDSLPKDYTSTKKIYIDINTSKDNDNREVIRELQRLVKDQSNNKFLKAAGQNIIIRFINENGKFYLIPLRFAPFVGDASVILSNTIMGTLFIARKFNEHANRRNIKK